MVQTQPVPPGLRLVIEFVNTLEFAQSPDPGRVLQDSLVSGAATARWLFEHGLLPADVRVGEADAEEARALRESLRALAMRNAGEEPPGRSIELPAWCASMRYHIEPSQGMLHLRAQDAGTTVRGALGEIIAIVYRAQLEGTWPRLKACRKHSCLWAFYDQSKNRSGAWCNMAVCGNRVKAQRRRARARA